MRTFIACLVLLVVLVSGLIIFDGYMKKESDAMLRIVDKLAHAAEQEDYKAADAAMDELDKCIEEKTPRLALFTDHNTLDAIMETAAEAKGYTKYRETPELCAQIETLSALIDHIYKRESFSLYNIF